MGRAEVQNRMRMFRDRDWFARQAQGYAPIFWRTLSVREAKAFARDCPDAFASILRWIHTADHDTAQRPYPYWI